MKTKLSFVLLSALALTLSACGSAPENTSGTFTVTWKNYDGSTLEVDRNVKEGTMPHYDGNTPTKPEDSEYTYTFKGWSPELAEVTSNQTYTATYSSMKKTSTYTITYILDGGTNSTSNPSSYTTGSSFTFADASKDGYSFDGWYDSNGNKVTGVTATTTGNLTLTAHYTALKNTLSVTSEDATRGTVAITSGSGYTDESITVVATPSLAYDFDGWYNDRTRVSTSETYTFTMPAHDYSLVARFDYNQNNAYKYGITPKFADDGNSLTYGLYPQTNVSNSTLISSLNGLTKTESNGWYFYNGDFYAKLVATPNRSGYKFDNGTDIVNGTTYWFKCEPIDWKILDNGTNGFYLLATKVLDVTCFYHSNEVRVINNYYVYPNDYEDSDIRAWLNGSFYSTAFYLDNDNIQVTDVDNSAKTTNSPNNWWWCNDTKDKVFLPCFQDYINTLYGFENTEYASTSRQCKTTDYARARGIYCYTKMYGYNGNYWTRSPNSHTNDEYTAWVIDTAGIIGSASVTWAASGVRPSITLKVA